MDLRGLQKGTPSGFLWAELYWLDMLGSNKAIRLSNDDKLWYGTDGLRPDTILLTAGMPTLEAAAMALMLTEDL